MKKILGYTDALTVRPGGKIAFKISAEDGTNYRAQLVRLMNGDTQSNARAFKEIEITAQINGIYDAREQAIVPGSCVIVESVDLLSKLRDFTVTLAFMPTTPNLGVQHLISRWDQRSDTGWSLQLNRAGQLTFVTASAKQIRVLRASEVAVAGQWYCGAIRVSGEMQTIMLNHLPLARAPMGSRATEHGEMLEPSGAERSGISVPLLIAAGFGGRTPTGHCIPVDCFNGRIEAPVIYAGSLTDLELVAVMSGQRPSSLSSRLVGDWDFSLDIGGIRVTDRSPNGSHGCTHNMPLRGVKGSSWSGSEMNWRHAGQEYGAIHFHTDDLYDCGWQTDISFDVPRDLPSGVYALRLSLNDEAATTIANGSEEYLPFFVASPKDQPRSDLAFLVPTATYLAYGNVRVWDSKRAESGLSTIEYYHRIWTGPGNGDYSILVSEHPTLGNSTYDHHLDGSPVHTSSWLRPLLNLRPKSVLWTFCADLLLIDWLDAKGFSCDVITDDLLQKEGAALLANYRVVMTGNHPEYQTTTQLDAFETYLGAGGRLIYMGGNGFYWRCAWSVEAPGVIEVRRGRTGTGMWLSDVGEATLAFTGEQGGICRDIGRPPQRLVGVGFIAQGHDGSHFRVLQEARDGRAAFILNGIPDEIVGDFGIFGTAVGQEIDKSNPAYGTPLHSIVVARSENHSADMIYVIEEMQSSDPVMEHYRAKTCAEVVFFETRAGGAVFSVGSMAWCGSLSHNGYRNNISTMTENVLTRFLDRRLFEVPPEISIR